MIRRILELAFVIAAAWAVIGGLMRLVATAPAADVVEVMKRGE